MRIAIVALVLAGCATPYPALTATAKAGSAAVSAFEAYDHAHKRDLLAAHPECKAQPKPEVCFAAVLAPYEVARDEVLRPIDALAPALFEAAHVAEQGAADKSLTTALAGKIASLTAAVLAAVAKLQGGAP